MAYKDLSVKERHAIIRAGVANGVHKLSEIEARYNDFTDPSKHPDYDIESYVRENPNAVFDHEGHYPDTYKRPNHPTFSDESIYASEQNPGGHWSERNSLQRWNFSPSAQQIAQPGYIQKAIDYLNNNESEGVTLTDSQGRYPSINGTIYGGVLPEVEVKGHRFEAGGHQYGLGSFIRGAVNKVNEKVPSIAPYTNAVLRRVGLYDPNEGQTEHVLNLTGKKMARVTKDTPNVESVLGNEFIEVNNPNTVQTVAEFKRMSPDTFLGDRHNKQLKNFSIFYGINPETQTFNIGPLDSLPDDLTVIPVRNKGAAIVDSIAPGSQITEKRRKALLKELKRSNDDFIEGLSNYNIEALKDLRSDLGIESYNEYKDKWYAGFLSPRGVLVSPFKLYKEELRDTQEYQNALKDIKEGAKKRISDDIESGKFDYSSAVKEHMRNVVEDLENPGFINLSNAYLDYGLDWNALDDKTKRILALEMPGRSVSAFSSYKDSIQNLKKEHVHFVDSINKIINDVPRYINKTTGEEIPFASKRDMGAKQYLISPDGAALFLHGYNNAPEDVEAINSFLSKHPAYPVLVDNGRYSHYQIGNGNVEKYISEGRVGGFPDEKMYIQGVVKKDGGPIHIAPSKRGTFTAAATKHGKSVQEFARQVLANKENYSPAMVRKAVFAHNSKSWNHSDGGYLVGEIYDVDENEYNRLLSLGYGIEII